MVVLKYHRHPWANIFDTDIFRCINTYIKWCICPFFDIYAPTNVCVKNLSLYRDLSLNKMSLNRDCTVLNQLRNQNFIEKSFSPIGCANIDKYYRNIPTIILELSLNLSTKLFLKNVLNFFESYRVNHIQPIIIFKLQRHRHCKMWRH